MGKATPSLRVAAATVGFLVCGLLCLGGCAAQSEQASDAEAASDASKQVVVTMTTESEPAAGFNPVYGWGCGEHVHEPLIQSTLITTDVDLNFVNDLATGYEASADGLTWTFTIRDDVRFTDGEPLKASDVAFTINTIVNTDDAEVDLATVSDAVATDDTTVAIHLKKPDNTLLYTLAVLGIVPEHAYGPDYGSNPIGSGRYMLEAWDRGQQVILKANPDYYGEAPKMERVVVLFMDEDASQAAAQAGEVDLAYTAATRAGLTIDGYSLLQCKSVDSRGISLPSQPVGSPEKQSDLGTMAPVGNAVTSDVAIRRAMNYGLDREAAVKEVLSGYGTPAYSVSDGMPWISPAMHCDYDVAEATRMLEEAGWTAGEDGVRVKDGVRAEVTLWYTAGDTVRQAFAHAFASAMEPLGIRVNVTGASFEEIYPHEFSDPVLWGWGSNSPSELYNLYYSTGWGNFSCYDSPEVDAAMDAALAQTTIEASYPHWQQSQAPIAPDAAATWVWIANVDHLYFERDGLHVAPQKPHPHGHGWSIVNNVDQWYWD